MRQLIETEIESLGAKLEVLANKNGMDRASLMENLADVDSEIAESAIPILKRRIFLLKQLWSLKNREESTDNVLLFSRTIQGIIYTKIPY